MADPIELYGFTAVPRSLSKLLETTAENPPAKVAAKEIAVPDSEIARKVYAYAKEHLSEQTFNHSMRVFYYGTILATHHLPRLAPSLPTFFLTSLLHDIGTTPPNLHATHLSFEFHGGLLALSLLLDLGAPRAQAESVAEAIIRHQDLGESGMITGVGGLLQLATVFVRRAHTGVFSSNHPDTTGIKVRAGEMASSKYNIGMNPQLIDRSTIESVTAQFPRKKWSSCFAATIREEVGLKPWCHTTAIEGFEERVEGNTLMEPYE